jgi:hypothetical protein
VIADWLYQVRIRVNANLSDALRNKTLIGTSKEIYKIAEFHGASPVCTYNAFCEYCNEAEREGVDKYPLYDWTKQIIDDPKKKQKHVKSFAFYIANAQVYKKKIAKLLHTDLLSFYNDGLIEDLKLIDSNPQNNPQSPKNDRKQYNA